MNRPCPFCGNGIVFPERDDIAAHRIMCGRCGAYGPDAIEEEEGDSEDLGVAAAWRAWDRRAPLCAPGDRQIPLFLIRFDDIEMGDMVFDDETTARAKWRELCGPGGMWNGYLFGLLQDTRQPK